MRRYLFIVINLFVLTESPAWGVEFSADMITQVMGQINSKFYFKNADTYREEGVGIISIVNAPMAYQIVPETKKYVVQKIDELAKDQPMGHYGGSMAYIKKHKMKKIGQETIQGYKCIIYEGGISAVEGQPVTPTKIWYAEKLKSMIKQEINIGPPMGNIVMILENIKTGKLDQSLFELPQGYTKVDSIEKALGLDALKISGFEDKKGAEPSPQEQEKTMQQIQKRIKQ